MDIKSNRNEQPGRPAEISQELQELFAQNVKGWFNDYLKANPKAVEFHFKTDQEIFRTFALTQLRKIVSSEPKLGPEEAIAKLEEKLSQTITIKASAVDADLLAKDADSDRDNLTGSTPTGAQ